MLWSKLREGDVIYLNHKRFFDNPLDRKRLIVKCYGGRLMYEAGIDRDGKIVFDNIVSKEIEFIRRPLNLYNDESNRVKMRNEVIKKKENQVLHEKDFYKNSNDFVEYQLRSNGFTSEMYILVNFLGL